MSKSIMYALEVIEDYYPKKNTTNYGLFALSILVSFCIHIVIVIFINGNNYYCFNCDRETALKTKPLSIQLYEVPEVLPLIETVKNVIEQEPELLKEVTKTITTQAHHTEPVIVKPQPLTTKTTKINYATLSASIESVVNEDTQKYQLTLKKSCDDKKRSSGKTDCIPITERLGYKADDPYDLAKIFWRLSNHSSSKKQELAIAQLISKQDTMTALLENENFDDETRVVFSDELAYLRGEIQYKDCGGSLNSGNCAGQVDLIKAASLLLTIFNKVVVD